MDMDYFKGVDIEFSRKTEIFTPDFTSVERGMYISRIDDDIITYDLRTRTPNCGSIMDNAAIHSLCHVFRLFIKNTDYVNKVIYFGPSECHTGFVFIVRGMSQTDSLLLVRNAFEFIRDYSGELPFCSPEECANCKEHSLDAAKKEATLYLPILNRWNIGMLAYPRG